MKFNQLTVSKKQKISRVGRGISAGKGKTAGRGTKGQNARSGGGTRPGFEGGQNPLAQRLPKLPGFRSIRPKTENIYTGMLDSLGLTIVDNHKLASAGLISTPYTRVKLIQKGDLKNKMTIKVQSASKSAIKMVEKAGGGVSIIERPKRLAKDK